MKCPACDKELNSEGICLDCRYAVPAPDFEYAECKKCGDTFQQSTPPKRICEQCRVEMSPKREDI